MVLSELDMGKAKSSKEVLTITEKICAVLDEPYVLKIPHKGKAETTVKHHCTSSIGVALFVNHEANAEDILRWADMAMYQAKEAGRNQIRLYDSNSRVTASEEI
jgi:diguanylate cyclase (GGDEF)-like protein